MHSIFENRIRRGLCLLICVALSGCAVDIGPYPQAQSMEAAVQSVLAKQGYYQGPIDGSIGPATSRAIRNYQRDHRLTPTGTINPALVASMGLAPQNVSVGSAPYYSGYPAYYSPYAVPAYYAPPVVGIGWGGGWPVGGFGTCWNRGWGGYGGYGYRGWGGGYRGYGGNYSGRCWR